MDYVNNNKSKNCLLTDVKLYVAADFYVIATLKTVAATSFEKHLTGGLWKTDSFPKALEIIYNDTPSSDRKLRDAALTVLMEHAAELIKFGSNVPTDLSMVIEKLPELSKDIAVQSLSEVEKLKSRLSGKDDEINVKCYCGVKKTVHLLGKGFESNSCVSCSRVLTQGCFSTEK